MSDYEKTQKKLSFVVGVFVIVALVAFFWMIFKFGDLPSFVGEMKSYKVRVQFPMAPGVQRDTPVRFCGYQIGRVTKVEPPTVMQDRNTGEYYHQTAVVLSIENAYDNIPAAVEAKLMTRGLGSSYIELRVPAMQTGEGKFLRDGSLLQGSTGMTSEFFPEESQKKLDELISGIVNFVNNANDIVGDPNNKTNLRTSLANLAKASDEATAAMKELRELAVSGKTTLQNADGRMERLTTSLVTTSDKLSSVVTRLDEVLAKINEGEGTAGKLVNDGRLYEQMLEDARQLELALQDIKSFVEQSREKGVPIKMK